MSRRFARVGVGVSGERLRDIGAGAPASDDELVDIDTALRVTEFRDRQRLHDLRRRNGQLIRLNAAVWLVVLVLPAASLAISGHHDALMLFGPDTR